MTTEERAEPGRKRRKGAWIDEQSVFWYRVTQLLVGLLLKHWIRCYHAVGAENLPSQGGAFLIANHTSAMDPFLVGYPVSQRMLWGPGKVELFANPVFAYLLRKIGIFPIRQHTADAAAVRLMVQLYRAGRMVIVYPEGGRSPSGELQPFFPEFARLAIKMKATLAPAAISGAREVLPMGGRVPKPRKPVAVVFGAPFDLSQFYGRPMTVELAEEAAAYMQSQVAALLVQAEEERHRLATGC